MAKPDFVFIQEAWGWSDYGHRQLARAKKDLSMEALPLPHSPTDNGVAILYRPEVTGAWERWEDRYTDRFIHGSGLAAFDVGLSNLLTVSSVHLDAFGSDRALHETELLIARAYRNGPLAVLGGDFNYSSSQGPDPDFEGIPPYNVAMRSKMDSSDSGPLKPDRRIGQKMVRGGFVDVAQYLFDKTKDSKYQEPTANHPRDRIDQFWVSKQVAPGIVDYQVLSVPEAASDHKGIAFQLDTSLIDDRADWKFQ
jgi:endonuclease/exonuclease/phosphatase family metal-dependent hydrolase